MSTKGKLRAAGAIVLLVNLWVIGRFDPGHVFTLLLTFGFAIAYELWVVRTEEDHLPKAFFAIGLSAVVAYFAATQAGPAQTHAPTHVARGALGGCPAGYVDHPADPAQCVLPIIAERMLRPRR